LIERGAVERAALAQPEVASVDQTHTVRHGDMISVVTEDRCNSLCMLQFEKAHMSAQFPNIFCKKKNVSSDQQKKHIKTQMLFGRSRIDELVLLFLLWTRTVPDRSFLNNQSVTMSSGSWFPSLSAAAGAAPSAAGFSSLFRLARGATCLACGRMMFAFVAISCKRKRGCESGVACTREWVREGM
jgi:hypothetical protein